MRRLSSVTDDALLESLHALVGSHRRVMADLIAHLSEVDARRLHANKGFSSLFGYCLERLGFSEDEACRRIEAARLMRRFPEIFSLLQGGAISLTVLGLLKHHLTNENHSELLAGVSGSSVRQAKEWLAARFPAADVPSSIRKLPARDAVRVSTRPSAAAASMMDSGKTAESSVPAENAMVDMGTFARRSASIDAVAFHAASATVNAVATSTTVDAVAFPAARATANTAAFPATSATANTAAFPATSATANAAAFPATSATADAAAFPATSATVDANARSPAARPAPARVVVEPLSRDRFLVKFTVSRGMREKLALASDLMRHANPRGDLSVVFERALDLLVADLEKRKQGRTKRPHGERRGRVGARVRDEDLAPDEQVT